jgi:small subunit ribosomal protein S19e
MNPNDVPASKLIGKVAKYLKENVDVVTPPEWASITKTGSQAEKQPENPDWWYVRSASLLRKIYVHGPIGIEKLRANYGGRKNNGVKPAHARKAGGSILRKALQQLETAGFIENAKPQGRKITPQGRKLLQELTGEVCKELIKQLPDLEKYQKGE